MIKECNITNNWGLCGKLTPKDFENFRQGTIHTIVYRRREKANRKSANVDGFIVVKKIQIRLSKYENQQSVKDLREQGIAPVLTTVKNETPTGVNFVDYNTHTGETKLRVPLNNPNISISTIEEDYYVRNVYIGSDENAKKQYWQEVENAGNRLPKQYDSKGRPPFRSYYIQDIGYVK